MRQMRAGRIVENNHPSQHYRTVFNQQTGFFARKEDSGWPEPTWSSDGPELIDLSITNYCERACCFCYRETKRDKATFMSVDNVERVAIEAHNCGTLQIALGGGNPNQHPQFVEILKTIRNYDIVPSYTTNGDGLTSEVLRATSDYCGAMAVSVYPPYDEDRYEKLLAKIRQYGITVNLHAIIKSDTLAMWIKWLQVPPRFFGDVNAIIFLNYKPVQGVSMLPDRGEVKRFFDLVNQCKCVKIGFDSCCVSGIVQWMDTPSYLIEACEAACFSAFISEDMKMYPCSFMVDKGLYGDLRHNSMIDIWQNNEHFKNFRKDTTPVRCAECSKYETCKGGCRLYPEINFCVGR